MVLGTIAWLEGLLYSLELHKSSVTWQVVLYWFDYIDIDSRLRYSFG